MPRKKGGRPGKDDNVSIFESFGHLWILLSVVGRYWQMESSGIRASNDVLKVLRRLRRDIDELIELENKQSAADSDLRLRHELIEKLDPFMCKIAKELKAKKINDAQARKHLSEFLSGCNLQCLNARDRKTILDRLALSARDVASPQITARKKIASALLSAADPTVVHRFLKRPHGTKAPLVVGTDDQELFVVFAGFLRDGPFPKKVIEKALSILAKGFGLGVEVPKWPQPRFLEEE